MKHKLLLIIIACLWELNQVSKVLACTEDTIAKIGNTTTTHITSNDKKTLYLCTTPQIQVDDETELKFIGIRIPIYFKVFTETQHKIIKLHVGQVIVFNYEPKIQQTYCIRIVKNTGITLWEKHYKHEKIYTPRTLSPTETFNLYVKLLKTKRSQKAFEVITRRDKQNGATLGSEYMRGYPGIISDNCHDSQIQWPLQIKSTANYLKTPNYNK